MFYGPFSGVTIEARQKSFRWFVFVGFVALPASVTAIAEPTLPVVFGIRRRQVVSFPVSGVFCRPDDDVAGHELGLERACVAYYTNRRLDAATYVGRVVFPGFQVPLHVN